MAHARPIPQNPWGWRSMWVIAMFDLPTHTPKARKAYTRFRKNLLEDAIARAWVGGGKRVWLHTCTLDHPKALSNYLARGFEVFKEEDLEDEVPDGPVQPWPGANKN